jgi:uncharacterized protein YlxW (UPF0749 family)
MDVYKIIQLKEKKISVITLICILIIFIIFFFNQCSSNYSLKKEISNMRKELKIDYQERIKQREIIIDSLNKDNQLKKTKIEEMNNKIDSLNEIKNKIITKYKEKIKDIKIMDSEKIKKYWYEEFN